MRVAIALVLAFAVGCLALADEPVPWTPPMPQPETLPKPRPLPPLDSCFPRPKNPLTEVLQQLSKEREALAAVHDAAARDFDDGVTISTTANAMLRLRIKQLLTQLNQQRAAARQPQSASTPPASPPTPKAAPKVEKPPTPLPPLLAPTTPPPAGLPKAVDPVAVAHALFRAGSNEAALQAFRLINLKGMRAEERAPIQYLMASCLRKLGKLDDALALYREVANSKGDEPVAACAQWQIANLRWQRETLEKLVEIRSRRIALEK
jgi:hypothetical protein